MKQRKCGFSHKLNAFSDGELSGRDFEKIQSHLKDCRICQKQLREIVKINSFLSTFREVEVPEYLNQRILAHVREAEQNKFQLGFSRHLVKFSIAASVLISFAAGVLLSDLAVNKADAGSAKSALDLGQTTLYSYFEGGE